MHRLPSILESQRRVISSLPSIQIFPPFIHWLPATSFIFTMHRQEGTIENVDFRVRRLLFCLPPSPLMLMTEHWMLSQNPSACPSITVFSSHMALAFIHISGLTYAHLSDAAQFTHRTLFRCSATQPGKVVVGFMLLEYKKTPVLPGRWDACWEFPSLSLQHRTGLVVCWKLGSNTCLVHRCCP